jgi:hypothetical protein
MKQTSVKLDETVASRLEQLQIEVRAEGIGNATRIEIVSALILETTAPQAAGMLGKFFRENPKTPEGNSET